MKKESQKGDQKSSNKTPKKDDGNNQPENKSEPPQVPDANQLAQQNISWDMMRKAYVYENLDTGDIYVWDGKEWKKEELDFDADFDLDYGDEGDYDNNNGKVGQKRKRKNKKKKNSTIFIKNLPLDVTVDELIDNFSKAGVIAKDPVTREFKIKIIEDDKGKRTGEALLKFFRPESLEIASQILQGFPIRLGGDPISYEIATPEQRKLVSQQLKKKKGVKLYNQASELTWEEKEQLHIIIKNMFDPTEAKGDPTFYSTLREDVELECSKLGQILSVKVFERNPEGVVAVKFANPLSAKRCIDLMDGRYFATRVLSAFYYDGYSNYYTPETEQDRKDREKAWSRWLTGNDDIEEDPKEKKGDEEDDDD